MAYETREIAFQGILEVNGWKIKVYTISKTPLFAYYKILEPLSKQLPDYLAIDNGFDSSNDKIGFLILHNGTEGVFSIINWWVGKNMLNTLIYVSQHGVNDKFQLISGNGLAPCVWELEVINHERLSWTENILKNIDKPLIEKYLNETITKTI